MGRITYEQAGRQGVRAYPRLQNYVVSRTLRRADYPEVTILGDDAERRIADLRNGTGKDIWLCGGGELLRRLLAARLVDTIELGVSPVLLGRAGASMLPADPPLPRTVRLELTRHVALPTGLLVVEYAIQHGTA
jgi:dihydrofolate reductase